jgi:hypothetical protein
MWDEGKTEKERWVSGWVEGKEWMYGVIDELMREGCEEKVEMKEEGGR